MSELTLKVSEQLEKRLRAQARQRGVSVADYARKVLETSLGDAEAVSPEAAAWRALTQEERHGRATTTCGSMAYLGGSVDDFLRRKQ